MNSSGAAIHWVSPSDSGPPMAKPMKPAACWRPGGVVRGTGPQVPQAQRGQRDHRRAEDQPRPGVGIGLGPHQDDRDRDERERQQQDGRADQHAQEVVDPPADRPGGVEPRARDDDDRDAQQRQRDAVTAVAGVDVAGAARPNGPSIRHPWRASASRRGRPGRWPTRPRGCATRCAVWPASGAGRAAPGGNPTVNRPLTCSNGHRSARRSY